MVKRISKESGKKKRVSKETKKGSKTKATREKTVEESASRRKTVGKKTKKGSRRGDKKRQKTKKRNKKNRSVDETETGSKRKSLRKCVGTPKKVQLHSNEIEQEKFEKLLARLKSDRERASRPLAPLDAKSKLLMDRVNKKAYPQKVVASRSQYNLLRQEGESPDGAAQEEKYDSVPKLADVQKQPEEDVFVDGVPFWAERPEPDDEDMKDVEPPISVGADHLEMYHEKKLTLRTLKDTKVVLDAFQPMQNLVKRDEVHFDSQLVFSNTIRSLINVCGKSEKEPMVTESTKGASPEQNIKFRTGSVVEHVYSRINPIESIRNSKTTTTTTTTTPD